LRVCASGLPVLTVTEKGSIPHRRHPQINDRAGDRDLVRQWILDGLPLAVLLQEIVEGLNRQRVQSRVAFGRQDSRVSASR